MVIGSDLGYISGMSGCSVRFSSGRMVSSRFSWELIR